MTFIWYLDLSGTILFDEGVAAITSGVVPSQHLYKQTNIIISDYQHENVCGAPCQLMLGLLMFNRNIFYYGDVAECGRVSVTPLQGSPHHHTPLPQSDGREYFCKLLIWNNADNLRLRDGRVGQS